MQLYQIRSICLSIYPMIIMMRIPQIITVKNNAIKTNYMKVKIENTYENSSCGQYKDRLKQLFTQVDALNKYKKRHDWVGKLIHWELCKRLNFVHIDKWYTYKPAFNQGNETFKILWEFQVQNGSPNPDKKTSQAKRTYLVGFAFPTYHRR